MDLAVVRVLRSNAQMIHNGAILVALQFLSLQPTFALQIMLFLVTMAAGATLLALILILPCPCSLKLPSTVLELSLSRTAGKEASFNTCQDFSSQFHCFNTSSNTFFSNCPSPTLHKMKPVEV